MRVYQSANILCSYTLDNTKAMPSCQHAQNMSDKKMVAWLDAYQTHLLKWVFPEKMTKLDFVCDVCHKNVALNTLVACLDCRNKLRCRSCSHPHYKASNSNDESHVYEIWLSTGSLFCRQCKDVVYLEEFELLLRRAQLAYAHRTESPCRTWRPLAHELAKLPNVNYEFSIRRMYQPFRGLVNMGSTCYLSVLIQALVQSPGLRTYLRNNVHRCATVAECMHDPMCELTRLSNHLLDVRQDSPVVPRNLYEILVRFRQSLLDPVMHDAQEAFYALLQAAHKSLTNTSTEDCMNSPEPCVIHELFCGHTMSKMVYEVCGHVVKNDNTPFTDLCVDVNTASICECLERFFSPVKVAGMTCSLCKMGPQPAHKRDFIAKDPQLLVITLKRSMHTGKKNTKHVSFPPGLDLNAYREFPSSQASNYEDRYELYAVVHHEGETSTSGHYYMFGNVGDRRWAKCNDEEVFFVDNDTVMRCNAYMLFYCKNFVQISFPSVATTASAT